MIGDKNVAEHVEQFAHLEQAYANRTKSLYCIVLPCIGRPFFCFFYIYIIKWNLCIESIQGQG